MVHLGNTSIHLGFGEVSHYITTPYDLYEYFGGSQRAWQDNKSKLMMKSKNNHVYRNTSFDWYSFIRLCGKLKPIEFE